MTGDVTAHPTAIVLERLSVGDLPPALRDDAARHVAGCPACGQMVQGLAAERDARLAAVPPERFVAGVANRRDRDASLFAIRRRRRLGAGLATVVAAAAAVVVLLPRPSPQVGLKGAGIAVYRSREQRVQAIASADGIRAGDALRVVVTLPRPAQVAAWSVDARGRVDSLLPGGALSLPAGEQALPDSAIVDNPCVDMKLVIVVGAAATAGTEPTLRRAVAGGVPAGDAWLPAGAIVRDLRCERGVP